jgi:adenosylmethionine-8-amino-7-oxononanoate aminotransferase
MATNDSALPRDTPEWQRSDHAHVWMPYTQMQTAELALPATSTSGVRITLADGRALIDGLSSWWTACHGYNHPHIRQAVEFQLQRMPHVMLGGLQHEPAVRLAGRLARLLPQTLDHVFFTESGSVSVEVAMKMALQFWQNSGQIERTRFVCFHHGYHGDTLATMALCDPENGLHSKFRNSFPDQSSVPLPHNAESLNRFSDSLAEIRHQTAAVILEPLVQGAGGMRFHSAEVLAAIATICETHNVLLILDEIATGFGRTGSMFACQQANVTPDIICLSKALTGGTLPLAATVARTHIYESFLGIDASRALMHGPTFMGNPLACAAANASLDLFEQQPRLEQAIHIQAILQSELAACRDLPRVVDVRSCGAIGVVQVEELVHLEWLRRRFVEEGVWLRPFGDAIYTTPPLVISDDDLRFLCQAIVRVVSQWSARSA